jgi:hypothetical protein
VRGRPLYELLDGCLEGLVEPCGGRRLGQRHDADVRFYVPTREVRARALSVGTSRAVRLIPDGIHLMPPEA